MLSASSRTFASVPDHMSNSDAPEVYDYTYHDGRPIQLDLWSTGSADQPRPGIVFFHPGKLVGKSSSWEETNINLNDWAFVELSTQAVTDAL